MVAHVTVAGALSLLHPWELSAGTASFDFGLGVDLVLQESYSPVSLYATMLVAAMVGALIRMECNVFAKHDM